ncbi:MAG TPA: acyltransferase [Capsulimonadaceae bacterium]
MKVEIGSSPPSSNGEPFAASPRLHLAFIDGIRALAALFVVLCHSYYEPSNGFFEAAWINHLGLAYGHLAVDVFIVTSGFCLMLSIARRDDVFGSFASYMKRRARRILPPYYAALGFSILFMFAGANEITGTVWDNSLPLTWQGVVAHVLLIDDLPLPHLGGAINYPLWSIPVEFQLYLFLPVIVWGIARFGNVPTLLAACAAGVAVHLAAPSLDPANPWYLGLFAFGAVAARQVVRGKVTVHYRNAAVAIALPLAAMLIFSGKRFFDGHLPLIDLLTGAVTALGIAATCLDLDTRKLALTRVLTWKPLVALGGFSYSLYLVHAPLLHALNLGLRKFFQLSPVASCGVLVCCIPAIAGVAYLFHRVFERPFMSSTAKGEA